MPHKANLIIIVLIFTLIAGISAFAAEKVPDDAEQREDFLYSKETNEIVGYIGENGICEIPENSKINSLKGNPIEKLIINNGVNLERPIFSAQLQTNLNSLKEVEIKEGITELPYQFLDSCSNLEKVSLPSTLRKISKEAFMDCYNLKSINFPDGLKSIEGQAFYGNRSLSEVILPDTITQMDSSAFSNCGTLSRVHMPNNLKCTDDKKSWHAWFSGTKIKEINIPDDMLNCPKCHFHGDEIIFNSDMTVNIYNMVEGSEWCYKYLKGKTDKSTGDYDGFVIVENTVLRYMGTSKNPTVPEGVKTIGESAFVYCDIDTVSLPKSLETISDHAFRMTTLKSIVIPQNVKNIGYNAFYYCPLLESVTVEGSPKLGDGAFELTNVLTEDTIVFKQNSQALMEQVRNSGMSEAYLPTFYDLLNQNRERVGFKPVTVPKEVEKQTKETPKPAETPTLQPTSKPTTEPTAQPTAEPTATPEPKILTVEDGEDITVKVNDKVVVFPDAKPFVDDNGRTQVPVRAVSELLNCKVDWQQDTSTAVIRKDNGDTVKITLNSNVMTINEKTVEMDTAATLKDDRTFIPVRFVAEALGMTVNWKE